MEQDLPVSKKEPERQSFPVDGMTEAAETGDDAPEAESAPASAIKVCSRCRRAKPLSHFRKRSGKRAGSASRRGICRSCRKKLRPSEPDAAALEEETLAETAALELTVPRQLVRRPLPKAPPKPPGPDPSILRPTREGFIRMRGVTDKGRRWYQETDLETAVTLVREYAAVVVNPHTIRRLYSNKKFRSYILTRDRYTCHFCGEYGDTIDHLLPRAKGGHTTPLNCVCACNMCNQSKADKSLEDFMVDAEDGPPEQAGPGFRQR